MFGQNSKQYTSPQRGIFFLLFFLFSIVLTEKSNAQCDAVTALKDKNFIEMSLFFYPSTLRMVNLDNNEEFNRLIQDIDKLIFFKMNQDFEAKDFYDLVKKLQFDEEMEEYIVVDGPSKKFYLLGREDPTETVGVAMIENQPFVFDVAGSLELKEIPKLYEYISQNDSTFNSKFVDILNIFESTQQHGPRQND